MRIYVGYLKNQLPFYFHLQEKYSKVSGVTAFSFISMQTIFGTKRTQAKAE